jgi:hypothetical protein
MAVELYHFDASVAETDSHTTTINSMAWADRIISATRYGFTLDLAK